MVKEVAIIKITASDIGELLLGSVISAALLTAACMIFLSVMK